ncbi:MAG TPA: transketolase [Bryobacteraceae bacterium]|jgi:transketolase|nr:transketolase [Bryobacteraceae bacterium]
MQPAETVQDISAGESMPLLIKRAKARLLRMHYEAGVGHIGGNLSCLDVMLTLHHRVLGEEDMFVLSKGHAVGALYVVLWSQGVLSDEDLRTFHVDGTRLSGHPPVKGIPEIAFATGSLGHGIGLAAGVALGKALLSLPGRVFCLTSDGEWNEGSCWESLIFAAHHKLDRLTIIVDQNGLQGFGSTREVAGIAPLADKFRAFGIPAYEIDGHDPEAIEQGLREASRHGPAAVIARTVKGHGVSFMENRMEWHYLPMTEAQYLRALSEI